MRHAMLFSVALATAACGAGANRSPADTGGITDELKDAKASSKSDALAAKPDDSEIGDKENPYSDLEAQGGAVAEARRRAASKPGDFHVYRYSGTFTKRPVTLTEQVLSVEKSGATVTDFVMEDGDKAMTALRVEKNRDGEIVAVTKRTKQGEEPARVADFERMMKRIQFVPDRNDELVSSEKTTCMVGADKIDCEVTKYKVTVGAKTATLSVARAADVTGRDLGGEIVTTGGKVIYSASLMERGNDSPGEKSVALLEHRLSPSR